MGEAPTGGRDRQGSRECDCKDQWMNITTIATTHIMHGTHQIANVRTETSESNSSVVECITL